MLGMIFVTVEIYYLNTKFSGMLLSLQYGGSIIFCIKNHFIADCPCGECIPDYCFAGFGFGPWSGTLLFFLCGQISPECCSCDSGDSSDCFPSSARVSLEDGKSVLMSDLKIGDKVQTGKAMVLEKIFFWNYI